MRGHQVYAESLRKTPPLSGGLHFLFLAPSPTQSVTHLLAPSRHRGLSTFSFICLWKSRLNRSSCLKFPGGGQASQIPNISNLLFSIYPLATFINFKTLIWYF